MEHIILSNMWTRHTQTHHPPLPTRFLVSAVLRVLTHRDSPCLDKSYISNKIYAILLDFAKASDKDPHKRLISKLAFYGLTGNTKNWIKQFLSHRKQSVSVNDTLSDNTCVTFRVPQGSTLGPVLCLLYINYINNNIQSPIQLFADDSIIYRKIKSETDSNIRQSDLIKLQR